jgi:hypothetical protein
MMGLNRRDVLKILPAAAAASLTPDLLANVAPSSIHLEPAGKDAYFPLETITVRGASQGTIAVVDGDGEEYLRVPAEDPFVFSVGGSLGLQKVKITGADGMPAAEAMFHVDCATDIDDEGGLYRSLLDSVLWTIMAWNNDAPVSVIRYKDRVYQFFVNWMFDHTLTMKGMKYYWPELKDAVDFFAATQRDDGMIWENCYPATPPPNYFDWKFHYGDFVRRIENGYFQLRRAPVESHVEQYFLECLYYTWKATGDHEWMKGKLDSAIRAVRYATHDPYRWSEKYQLMHRGFTIDTWDYTSDDQQKIGSNCVFVVYLDKSEFGVFYGDNTNLIAGCRRLAEMLTRAGRAQDAPEFVHLADQLRERLDALAWNGSFYTHWIAENPDYHPQVGVDMSKQVSLSNAWSLNRGISHEKCVAILNTYQRIRQEMPRSSPGEFYGIYPPFEMDFTQNGPGMVWEYVNGGVLSVVAGELAKGAFENGFEDYGVDILKREKLVADRFHGYLPVTLRGKGVETPQRTFHKIDLRQAANATYQTPAPGVAPWIGNQEYELTGIPVGAQEFQGIPFDVIDPGSQDGRCCLGLAPASPYVREAVIPVNAMGASVYLLHVAGGKERTVGILTIRYADGSSYAEYIESGTNIGGCFEPTDSRYDTAGPRTRDTLRIAWTRTNKDRLQIGIYAAGIANPHPDREIESIQFESGIGSAVWMILAATLSSSPVFFAPYDDLSTGIPDGWSASVIAAVIEGLAGVVDEDVSFRRTRISPRWEAAEVAGASVAVRYPSSKGYCSYRYRKDSSGNRISLELTGTGRHFMVEVLMPRGRKLVSANLNGKPAKTRIRMVEQSQYLEIEIPRLGVHRVDVELAQ